MIPRNEGQQHRDHRLRGILLPVFSLPSGTGVGCFSAQAYEFIDFLAAAGQNAWQILPLGPIDQWYSPYQPCSTCAGEPLYIDPVKLKQEGLLTSEELDDYFREVCANETKVCYEQVIPAKKKLLRAAYARVSDLREKAAPNKACDPDYLRQFDAFCEEHSDWLADYCLFMALREHHGGKPWTEWEPGCASRDPQALEKARHHLRDSIDYYAWQQYEFFRQWNALRGYAGERGIQIIGDMPYYVTLDSVECWKDPSLFRLDGQYRPIVISGAPGDRFDRRGQVWNSPVYDWASHEESLISWWGDRIRRGFDFYDIIRLDHVRAFTAYFAIPADRQQARYGFWQKGPGAAVFEPLREEISRDRLIAEDLGVITEDVREMMRKAKLPGMAVLQFAFDSGKKNPYRPENIRAGTAVYTGTHDNDTTAGWYRSLKRLRRWRVDRFCRAQEQASPGQDPADTGRLSADARAEMVTRTMINAALRSRGSLVIIPLQDYLALGSEARINTPGTTGDNWCWRVDRAYLTEDTADRIRHIGTAGQVTS